MAMTRSCVRPACFVFCLGLVFLLAEPIAAQVVLPIRMRAFAVNMSNNLTGANGIIQITLDQWSTEQERATLLQTVPKGQDDLVRALQKKFYLSGVPLERIHADAFVAPGAPR